MALAAQIRSSAYRALLEEFIEGYRCEPCLWQLKNRDYYNREKRTAALDRLLAKLRRLEPTAEREDVMRKINSMRTTYNKERRKVLEAEAEGSVRVPKLWCYGLLAFLDEKDAPERAGGCKREPPPLDGEELEEEHELEMQFKDQCEEPDENEVTIEHTTLSIDQSDNEDPIRLPRAKKRKTGLSYAHDTLHSVDSHSRCSREDAQSGHASPRALRGGRGYGGGGGGGSGESADDRHDIYCRSVACKLRDLPKHQRLIAEKLINEVLFEAEWGNLTLKHKLAH